MNILQVGIMFACQQQLVIRVNTKTLLDPKCSSLWLTEVIPEISVPAT